MSEVSCGHERPKPQLGSGGCPTRRACSPQTVALSSFLTGHAHLTDFNIATIIKDGERATALAGTKPYMGELAPPGPHTPASLPTGLPPQPVAGVPSLKLQQQVTGQAA